VLAVGLLFNSLRKSLPLPDTKLRSGNAKKGEIAFLETAEFRLLS
jgi:hypothetical protein